MKTLDDALAGLTTAYSAGFFDLLRFVIPHEVEFELGHYGDYDFVRTEHDPNDPGGTTRYGLDARDNPHLDIENLTLEQAAAAYNETVYLPLRGPDLPAEIALALCDAAINCGIPRSVRWLQELIGAEEDGNIGAKTVAAAAAVPDPAAVAKALDARRDYYYRNEVRVFLRDEYLRGWEARVADLDIAETQLAAARASAELAALDATADAVMNPVVLSVSPSASTSPA